MPPGAGKRTCGEVIHDRRRQLGLSQEQLARRISISSPYVAALESGKRHPSDKLVARLARILGLDLRELFFLANPDVRVLVSPQPQSISAWEQLRDNRQLRQMHNVTAEEMKMLSGVALCGEVRAVRDLIYVLNAVRLAMGR
jgi:DNA-binding XRE family transcriptional regulator